MLPQFYYKKSRFQQLRGFCQTVQSKSISEAAKKLNLTQSAVTMQIKSLERDLGLELFNRSKKQIEVNENGNKFYTQIIKHIQGIDNLFDNFSKNLDQEKEKIITIGANHASICYILPKYIKKFKQKHQNIQLKIENLSKKEGISRLIDNKIDFLIFPIEKYEIPCELEYTKIRNYYPILLTTKDSKIAKKSQTTFNEIKNHELIRIDPKFITLPNFENTIKANELKQKIEFENADWEILKKFVEAKIGVAIISNIIFESSSYKNLIGIKIKEYQPQMSYAILTKSGKTQNKVTQELIESIKQDKKQVSGATTTQTQRV